MEDAADAIVGRLWRKDASLWSDDPGQQALIRDRLGWLDIVHTAPDTASEASRFARRMRDGGVERVFVLGMGGSSLCAEVCRRIFSAAAVEILDSTVPATVLSISRRFDPASSVVVVASKSGTTLEARVLADLFLARAAAAPGSAGRRFTAITDAGTPLDRFAEQQGFCRVWQAPGDVGGRFSALTYFGVVPMALMGIDVAAVVEAARRMAVRCGDDVGAASNPGARLGMALLEGYETGRDKITFLPSRTMSPFGLWVEQLVAESTGKDGKGFVPVADEPPGAAADYGDDRIFVSLKLADDDDGASDGLLDELEAAGHPVLRFVLADRCEIGAEFFRWEFGVAVAGALMGINPFDQPDVQSSKDRTGAILRAHRESVAVEEPRPVGAGDGWQLFADLERDPDLELRNGDGLEDWLAAHLRRAGVPDYLGLQAFLPPEPRTRAILDEIRAVVGQRRGIATTLGWGPGFLHSTGQLHKGGPGTGVFLQITAQDREDIDCPGRGYTFGTLTRAQARGDLAALQERGRRVVRVHLDEVESGLAGLADAARRALRGC